MMATIYKRPFSQFVKKQSKPFKARIEDEVKIVCTNPRSGELKVGDLSGIRIHKFKFKGQEYLIAYSFLEQQKSEQNDLEKYVQFVFYKIGLHENFYEDLKNYLKS